MKRLLPLIMVFTAFVVGCKKNAAPDNEVAAEAAFTSVTIEAKNNTGKITSDVICTIAGDSVTAIVPQLLSSKQFVLSFTTKTPGTIVKAGDVTQVSGSTLTDFADIVPYELTLPNGSKKTYRVIIKVFTGLPILYITTSTGADVTSKEVYINGTVVIDANKQFQQEVTNIPMQIRGRGNSTWANYPKKPYKLKLNSKTALLGMPAAKDWALLANYNDKTMMRTKLAFDLGRRIGADFTPQSRFVEVVLNGQYWGNYQLASTVEIHENRVNIKELKASDISGGYLLELDYRMDAITNWRTNKNMPFTLKDPDEVTPEQLDYIKKYIQDTENALYASDWNDPVNGYAKYIDPDSFMRWYAVEEIVKNQDSWDFSSIYFYKNAGGKLGMGPIWDFDISMGNCDYSPSEFPENWYTRNGTWMIRLAQDPAWNLKWRAMWANLRTNQVEQLLKDIDANAKYLKLSAAQNFKRWPILDKYVYPNAVVLGDYDKEVAYLKEFMTKRIAWIDANIKSY